MVFDHWLRSMQIEGFYSTVADRVLEYKYSPHTWLGRDMTAEEDRVSTVLLLAWAADCGRRGWTCTADAAKVCLSMLLSA